MRSAWVTIAGELDVYSTPDLQRVLAEAQRDARLVVVDLGEVTFIAAAGVQAILAADRQARRDGHRLAVLRGPKTVYSVFVLTGATDDISFLEAG